LIIAAFAGGTGQYLAHINEAQERDGCGHTQMNGSEQIMHGKVRSLEQQEAGENRRLRCADCGQQWFESWEQLRRNQLVCRDHEAEKAETGKMILLKTHRSSFEQDEQKSGAKSLEIVRSC
jgi:hypothetical protein